MEFLTSTGVFSHHGFRSRSYQSPRLGAVEPISNWTAQTATFIQLREDPALQHAFATLSTETCFQKMLVAGLWQVADAKLISGLFF